MAPQPRTPNASLERLLDQARWSRTQLANAVNRVGDEVGLELRYDQSAVSHWLSGTMPRTRVRPLVCEALARRLGRPVTQSEAGLSTAPGGDDERVELAEQLIDIGRSDMDPSRRNLLQAGLYSATLSVPVFSELAGRSHAVAAGRTAHIGPGEVATVRTMTERVADILDELGGGHARPMAAAFLVNTVGPYLRASAREDVRRDMLSAASDLVYLTGWMAMYERDHGLGQRYYVKALELAAAADDHVTYCRTLRGMSLQATSLGHGNQALRLADSAAEASPKGGPRLRAFLAGQQAYAASMAGDRRQAFSRLREAEGALSRADARREAIGGYDQCAYQFHVSAVLYQSGDLPGSISALRQSIRVQPPQERQGRVHAYAILARRQFEHGHVDAACESWHRFLDDYQFVSTARGDAHLESMRRRVGPYRRTKAVRQLLDRSHEVAAMKA
ncbi:hypothetical protein ACTWP5_21330 [Streptomyces sp. 4N509B]|uniref:hypothetical protein n=1 Tax=Streptomyces sp. 4N509B TaxID=3457413 RepID=UPI003FD21BBE